MYKSAIAAVIMAALIGCSSTAPEDPQFELAVFHINDHHSNLAAKHNQTLTLAGVDTQVDVGGFPRVIAMMNQLADRYDNHLKLHAGDAITGDLYYSLFKGEADARFMNLLCFDAFTLGNHEFDDSDEHLKLFLDALAQGDCNTPVLSANLRPALGTPLAAEKQWQDFQPYTIKQFGHHKVGIIGLTIAQKTKNSSQPLATTEFLDETETARYYIRELQQQGVGKIILLTHYDYANDVVLAQALPEVDLIVGGDSHTLLGKFDEVGLTAEGDYPTRLRNADGELVCVVQGKDYSQVVGELVLQFNGDSLTSCNGRPHMMLGDNFSRHGQPLTAQQQTEVEAFIASSVTVTQVTPEPKAQALLEEYSEKVRELSARKVAEVPERLCRMVPGKLRETSCGNNTQSDLHYLVSAAFLHQSRQADIALQNAGGVRSDLPAGDLSIAQIYQLLPFSNTLVNLTMTGEEIKQVLEDAVSYVLSPGGSDGAYPQGAGIQFDVDMTASANQRISNITVWNKQQQQWVPVVPQQNYVVVTNSFIAGGLDGWVTFGQVSKAGRIEDTYLNYAQAFIDYAKELTVLPRPAADAHSTRNIVLP